MIRGATREDLAAVAAIERACFPSDALPLISLVQYFELFADTFIVADDGDGAIAGFAIAGASAANAETAWVLDIVVAPEARKRGLASQLLASLIAALKGRVKSVRATVSPDNAASLALFSRAGFEVERQVADYFGPGEMRNIVRLDLGR